VRGHFFKSFPQSSFLERSMTMSNSRQLSVKTVLAVLLLSGLCFGGVITVDADATGNNDGSSWPNAYRQLQSAIAAASSGDEIRVAQGVYWPAGAAGDRAATFQLLNGVTIKGGYAGSNGPDPDVRDIDLYETILSGDLNGDDGPDFANNDDNSYHVVTGSFTDETAILDGFTIIGGNADGTSPDSLGGGMYTSEGSPVVRSCTFTRNFALAMGGGMFNYQSCPIIINCVFAENRSDDDGGGIRNYLNSHAIITNCDFIANSAFEEGGGLNNRKNSNAIVTGCMFIGNAAGAGGGMENHDGRVKPTGIPIITNCTFIGNISSTGGGMRNNDVSAIVTNCTFVGNTGSGMNNRKNTPTITSCIFWSNTGGSFDGSGNPTVTFSDVEGGFPDPSNIDVNPNFVQLGHRDFNGTWVEGDYYLLAGSPCIDAGDPDFVPEPNETDIEGRPRVINGRVDMGAYEYEGSSEPDDTAPTPDPMAWATPPYATGSTSIMMEATIASDISGVEYYFECILGSGHDSGWQNSLFYEDVGLDTNTQYTYRVKARDRSVNHNETAYSPEGSATTDAACIASTMHVESIVCETLSGSKGRKKGMVTVMIYDNCGEPVANAWVKGTFTGDYSEAPTPTVMTDGNGVAVIMTSAQVKKPSYTFCVDNVTYEYESLVYQPNDNVETCRSN
jgi:hypothetical protein